MFTHSQIHMHANDVMYDVCHSYNPVERLSTVCCDEICIDQSHSRKITYGVRLLRRAPADVIKGHTFGRSDAIFVVTQSAVLRFSQVFSFDQSSLERRRSFQSISPIERYALQPLRNSKTKCDGCESKRERNEPPFWL